MTGTPVLDARVRVGVGAFDLDATAEVGAGEIVVVAGPNGAGKTTLLRAVAGLVPLHAGYVRVDGVPIDGSPPERRPVALVFQDTRLFPHLDTLGNVAFGLRARGVRARAANARARALLQQFGLDAYARALPHQLSGGQAKRVALARALAVAPRVLLLDEPLAALDATAHVEVRRALHAHLASYEGARLLVTHDPLEALTLADRIVVLEAGRVVQAGVPDEIRRHPASPYVAQFLGVNLLEGVLESADVLRLSDGTALHVALDASWRGSCLAVVEPTAITLYADPPHASARNVWAARVVELDREPHRVRVRLDAPVPLVADVTLGAADELGLAPGVQVWCALKATAVTVRPR